MEGSEYDKRLKEIEDVRVHGTKDREKVCRYAVGLVLNTRTFRHTDNDSWAFYILPSINTTREISSVSDYGRSITLVDDKNYQYLKGNVDKNIFDNETTIYAEKVLDDLHNFYSLRLSEKIRTYKYSLQREISKCIKKSERFRIIDRMLQVTIIMGATTTPIFLSINELPKIIPIIISWFVAVAAGLSRYFKFGERHLNDYTIAKKLEHELTSHENRTGAYNKLAKGAAFDLFAERIIAIRQEHSEISIALEKKALDEKDIKIIER